MMKKSIINFTLLPGLLYTFTSCQEIFNPELEIETLNVPSIEAIITDSSSMCMVDVKEVADFNARFNNKIKDATVRLIIDSVDTERFTFSSNLKYTPESNGFIAEYGKNYTLNIQLNDGSEYISKPCALHPLADSIRFYIEPGVNNYVSANIYGDPVIKEISGYNTFYDLFSSPGNTRYYRQSIKVVYQYVYYVMIREEFREFPVYAWQIRDKSEIPKVQRSENSGDMEVVMRENLNFLDLVKNNPFAEMETREIVGYHQSGWIIIIDNYSINEDAYMYYSKINKQLAGENQYFDPLPSQIYGNIHNTENSEKLAFGLFELSSMETKAYFITSHSYDHGQIYELENYQLPDSLSGTVDEVMPDFFVNEYFLNNNK